MNRDYQLHQLGADEYEALVVQICLKLLGSGTTRFSPGPDGGRDARFTGTADIYPSKTAPWSGKFVIQAKWTGNPVAKCSDNAFWLNKTSVLEEELPRIKALRDSGEVDNYLLFTNRALAGRQEKPIVDKILQKTGVEKAALLALETIHAHLDASPEIVKACGLDRYWGPLRFSPEQLANVIEAFHVNRDIIPEEDSGRLQFQLLDLDTKNELNHLGEEYFEIIKRDSELHFRDIEAFLSKPINEKYASFYYDIAHEFDCRLTIHRDQFGAFEEMFERMYDDISKRVPQLEPKRLIWVFVHYMYCVCDIGKK